ncbi:unnamed protein product [Aphanomyces euteiches]
MLISPRKKLSTVRDPDRASIAPPSTAYNLYPFHGLQSPPKLSNPSKSSPKRLQRLAQPVLAKNIEKETWVPLSRPFTPLSSVAPSAVASHLADEQHPHIKPDDLAQIEAWLDSFDQEAQSFTSYFLFCELKFQQSAVLATGRNVPNRLRTAVAFYCLQQASSIFGRYQSLLDTICTNLGSAIYSSFSALRRGPRHVTALECYQAGTTYFEQVDALQKENAALIASRQAFKDEVSRLQHEICRLETQSAALKDATASPLAAIAAFTKMALDGNEFNPVSNLAEREKMGYILKTFKSLGPIERIQVFLSMIELLDANPDVIFAMINTMPAPQREEVIERLIQDLMADMQQYVGPLAPSLSVLMTSQAQEVLRHVEAVQEDAEEARQELGKFQERIQDVLAGTSLSDLDIPHQEVGVMEALAAVVEALAREKEKVRRYEARVFTITAVHSKNKAQSETLWMDKCHDLEAKLEMIESEKQRLAEQLQSFLPADDAESTAAGEKIDQETQVSLEELQKSLLEHGNSQERRVTTQQPGGFVAKTHKSFVGLYTMIQEANYSVASVKRIVAKKRPLGLLELHQTIAGFYQSKMSQDIADDNMHRPRQGFAQMLLDSYTVFYGLRELAVSQLITLDASIRKFSPKSARVRIFGLLVGSLEPGSYASSVPATDFFLSVVGVLFNVGNYRLNEDKAQTNAKQLKTWLGDGMPGSSSCTNIPLDKLIPTIQIIFATSSVTVAFLDDLCCAPNDANEVDLDTAMEKILYFWLQLYEQQVATMHGVFRLGDKDTNGVLDFQEFSTIVHHFDPGMSRRDCLDLYNRVAGADNVIDKDEFVMGMINHLRDLELKTYFSTNYTLSTSSSSKTRAKGDVLGQPQMPFNPVRQLGVLLAKFKAAHEHMSHQVERSDPIVNWEEGIDPILERYTRTSNAMAPRPPTRLDPSN